MADSLLQEVDEALRADRAALLWKKYRATVIAVAALLVLGTALNSGWQYYRQAQGGKALFALTQSQKLLEAGKASEAATSFKAVADGASGELKALALIWQARALVMEGKKDEAAAALNAAVATGQSVWADIACLRLAGLDSKAGSCLGASSKSPLASTRAEWAAADAWVKGEHEVALAAIDKLIADESASQDARARLLQWRVSMKTQQGAK